MNAVRSGAEVMIRMRGLRVDYADVTAVKNLSLEVGAGEVFGLIGPNGAGKSSTIRVLATLQEPTHGEVWIGGIDAAINTAEARRLIGYMPDLAPVHADLRCWEFLDLYGASYGMPKAQRRARIEECLDAVGLTAKRDAMAGTLSRGMTQRLVLAKTILPSPRVLLLDEPASGLDPMARIRLRDLLKRLASEGRTVLVSSHILAELSEFCTSIGIMRAGEMVLCGSMEDVTARIRTGRRYALRFAAPVEDAPARLASYGGVGGVHARGDGWEIDFSGDDGAAGALLASMVRDGLPVCAFSERKIGMEDILLHTGATEAS